MKNLKFVESLTCSLMVQEGQGMVYLSILFYIYTKTNLSIYCMVYLSIYPIVQYGHALNIQTDNIAVTHRNGNYEGLQRNSCQMSVIFN